LGEHIKADVEEIEESLPGWAIALITIGLFYLLHSQGENFPSF